ncbi:MAG: ATP-dependent sacrificial sulfur transferase LarE [Planctomycetia bacterium]|nr:ATP-dependent sacrificial sulfur transferase LarE [Planctomycetia bacterium]
MPPDEMLLALTQKLIGFIRRWHSGVVAFSGGVDSAVVAKAAQIALGDGATAVTGVSASLAQGELDDAINLAALIGIRHEIVDTTELDQPEYVANDSRRCYFCKQELYSRLEEVATRLGAEVIFSGAIVEDLGDYRPGLAAAAEHQVEHPLAACGVGKEDVRRLAAHWNLPVADKPASPCLSSRIAYGEEVTPERLAIIDAAERLLRDAGFSPLRVRYHRGDVARIEVPLAELPTLAEPAFGRWVVEEFMALGFKYVTLDLAGFRSGSMNLVLPVESLRDYATVAGGEPPPE